MENLPIIIILLPLCTALLSLALFRINLILGRTVVAVSLTTTLVLSVVQLKKVINTGTILYFFGNYEAPYGVEFSIDGISAVIVVLIAVMGLLTVIFCFNLEMYDNPVKLGGAYSLLCLLVTGMLGMTSTGDAFNMYIFLEITSISAYVLIALGGSRGVVASFRYLLVGTVAATFYLLAIGILYANTGTLNLKDMSQILAEGGHQQAMVVAMGLLVAAFGIKMALFPFHGWQPAAYTHAYKGARPLIAGVMGKIPAYALFRYLFCVFGESFGYMNFFLTLLGVLATLSIFYGSIRAMSQTDFRKILAYSSVAQIGYVILGFAIGNPIAIAGAFLHVVNHAFMKGGLFFSSTAIRYKYGTVNINEFGQIYKKMPLTSALIVIAGLAMVGIPPTAGFFSKWYIALGAAQTHQYIYIAVLVLSSLLNAVYYFKIFEKMFMGEDKHLPELHTKESRVEEPMMMIPIVISFLAILLLGIFNTQIMDILLVAVKEALL